MTNKVKPFYITITDDMTPQMVQDALDKCVNAGARAMESIKGADTKIRYVSFYPMNFRLFGVNNANETSLYDYPDSFGIVAKEITLDQLDEWLGIDGSQPKQVEWKNGDNCEHGHHDYSGANKMTYIGAHPFISGKHVCLSEMKGLVVVDSVWLRKPETPEQKAERERLESIDIMVEDFLSQPQRRDIENTVKRVCSTLYDAGYRKQ